MTDPTIKRCAVLFTYTGSDGYRAETRWSSRMCPANQPQVALLDAIEELARITALFGFAEEAKKRVADAQARVAEWRKS